MIEQREWKRREAPHSLLVSELKSRLTELAEESGLSEVTLRVCAERGMIDLPAINQFLNPRLEDLTDPFLIRDMDRAIDRLVVAREKRELIRIFGDYDVDGTTGAALLSWVFREFGLVYDVRQPDRVKDGYGLNPAAATQAGVDGAAILLTVDCGITSFDASEKAAEAGVDLIVVDHHQVDPVRGIPKALAVLNPQRADCLSGLKQLCGCGLAFYLALALRKRGRELGWWKEGAVPNLKRHLDLVVMATAADMVPLTGDNHILVRHGMEVLKQSQKQGVRALLLAAGMGARDLSPGHLGFVLGPRINASGRMGSASTALELLSTEDPLRATVLARELELMNQERAETQNRIWDEVKARVEEGIAAGKFKHGIVVADRAWHEGVVGIVASRVTETFRRPAAVIALREDFGKGSVRSYAGKDVLDAIRTSGHHLLGFGGHKYAAGLSVAHENVAAFADAFDAALGAMEEDASAKPLWIEGDCLISDLSVKTLTEIERMGPFGPGNPEPVFSLRAQVRSHRVLKDRHLKLQLGFDRTSIEAIWFNAIDHEPSLLESVGKDTLWAGVPELNRFRGKVTPSFRVRDWRGA